MMARSSAKGATSDESGAKRCGTAKGKEITLKDYKGLKRIVVHHRA